MQTLDNLEEIKIYNLSRSKQKERESLFKPLTIKEINSVMRNPPTKKRGPNGFTGEFYQILKN